jgi:ribose transport system permease protein
MDEVTLEADQEQGGQQPSGDAGATPAYNRRAASNISVLGKLLMVLQLGPVLVLVILCVVMGLLTSTFLSEGNVQDVLIQSSVVSILAIGELTVILTGGIDLSVAANMALATVIGWYAFESQTFHNGIVVIASMLGVGTAVGLVNGVIYVKGRVPHPFIVTLATLSIAGALALTISKGQAESGMPSIVNSLGNGFIGPVPMPAVVLAVVATAAWWFTRRTQWGQWIFATGGNREAATRVGIPVGRILISVYVVCGLMAGIGAVLTAGSIDGASATLAEDPVTLLNAIAGVIIGGASLFGGRGSVWNAIVGALTIGVIENGLALLNISPFAEGIFVGATILAAVEFDVLRTTLETRIRTVRANLIAI